MDDALEKYAEELQPIYRDILAAFPAVDPGRKMGYGLAFQTINVAIGKEYGLGQIQIACAQLANHGIVEIRNGIFVHPTELGEHIISLLTGHELPVNEVPPLSPPPALR
jgi:hypothetical protein